MTVKDVESVETETVEVEDKADPEVKTETNADPVVKKDEAKEPKVETTETAEVADETKEDADPKETAEDAPKEDADPVDDPVNVDELLADITDKDQQVSKLSDQIAIEQETVATLQAQVTEYEAVIKQLVETKVANVPEEFRELMPDGSMTKQLEWINKAEEKGLFSNEKKTNPAVDIGKPLKAGNADGTKGTPEKVTAHQRLSNFFSSQYGN